MKWVVFVCKVERHTPQPTHRRARGGASARRVHQARAKHGRVLSPSHQAAKAVTREGICTDQSPYRAHPNGNLQPDCGAQHPRRGIHWTPPFRGGNPAGTSDHTLVDTNQAFALACRCHSPATSVGVYPTCRLLYCRRRRLASSFLSVCSRRRKEGKRLQAERGTPNTATCIMFDSKDTALASYTGPGGRPET